MRPSAPASNTALRRTGRPRSNTTTCSWAPQQRHDRRRLGFNTRNVDIKQDADIVTVRVNYRFGGPVVAKYLGETDDARPALEPAFLFGGISGELREALADGTPANDPDKLAPLGTSH